MKPATVESLRGIQAAMTEAIVPELSSAFAQDTAQTIQMLIESLAGEIDTAAEDLHADNRELRQIMSQARETLAGRNEDAASLVHQIDEVLVRSETEEESLRLSSLTARNDQLRAVLEKVLMYLEDTAGQTDSLQPLRQAAYAHLRRVAVRGWSFWDLMSFRERMARARADYQRTNT